MRILRSLTVAGLFGVSLTIIGFTCIDRLGHPVATATPVPTLARPALAEPVATGSLPEAQTPAPAKVAKPARPKAVEGFDTERLNALMRGDPSVTLSRTR